MPRCRSCSRNCRRSRTSWSRTSCRRRSPCPASSACCSCCSTSASRSATSPPSSKASPRRSPFTRNPVDDRRACALAPRPPDLRASTPRPAGYLPLIALSAEWEQAFAESIVGQGDERSLAMQPSRLPEFITAGARALRGRRPRGRGAGAGHLARHPAVRARHRRALPRADRVLSQAEIHPRVRLKTVGSI